MRAARSWGVPPLTMWGGNGRKWTDKDRLLALAVHLHDASLCPDCRQPARLAHDPEWSTWYDTETVDCGACAATERDNKAARAKGDPTPGEKRYPVFNGPL